MKKIILLVSLMACSFGFAQPGALDHSFNPTDVGFGNGDGPNASVTSTNLQLDGKIIIGGYFSSYNGISRNGIARLNPNGSLDASFNPGTGANAAVWSTALQPDGKIIIGGEFTSYNGTTRNKIARLNADGSLDTSFNPGTGPTHDPFNNAVVWSVALQADGKILIGGEFIWYNGTERPRIARLNADGSLDASFNSLGTGTNGAIYAISCQPDGKIIIGAQAGNCIARLNPDGSLDSSFNVGTGATSEVNSIALQPNGKIIIGGVFNYYNGIPRNKIARLNTDGSLDTAFNSGIEANSAVQSVSLQPNGKIIIGGYFLRINGSIHKGIARLNADGSLETSFNPGTLSVSSVDAIALQPDGKIIIGGDDFARLNADGSLDTAFNPGGTGANRSLTSINLQPDGKIIIGGEFTSYNGTTRNKIARLNADGSLDASFNPGTGANGPVWSTALQTDGKIIIAGVFWGYNGTTRNSIARLNANGSLDTSFNPGTGTDNGISAIALQPDGKIIISGLFTLYNGTARNKIARLNADGSLDTSFNPGTGVFGSNVYSIALQPNGKIIIGGYFISYNGTQRNNIARLNADGSLDTSFNMDTGILDFVNTPTVQPDGRIVVGGGVFDDEDNSSNHGKIIRLNTDGSLDTSFNPGVTTGYGEIKSTILQPDGKIIISGRFVSYNGVPREDIALLNADGSLDTTFNSGSGADGYGSISKIALQPDGKIIIGGQFTSYNGTGRNRIARIYGSAPLSSNQPGYIFSDMVAYPNPFSENFTLEIPTQNEGTVVIKIYDTIGRLLEQTEVKPSNTDKLKMGNGYPSGIYNVLITQGKETKTLKVIKK